MGTRTRGAWRAAALVAVLAAGATRGDERRPLRVPEEYTDLRRALLAAEDGDVILVAAGRHEVGALRVDRAVTIRGAGPDVTVLAGDLSRGPAVHVSAGASLQDLTLTVETTARHEARPLLEVFAWRGDTVTLRDLVLERPPADGLCVLAGAVDGEGLEVRAPGGVGVRVERMGPDEAFFAWPRATLRRLRVRDAGAEGVVVSGCAGARLEDLAVSGARAAHVRVRGGLAWARVQGPGGLRVVHEDGASPYQAFMEARARAVEAAERASFGEQAGEDAVQDAARQERAALARLVRAWREGLQAEDEAHHAAALTEYAQALAARWEQAHWSGRSLLTDALHLEVVAYARRRGPEGLARWLLTAPAPPPREGAGAWFLAGLSGAERAALTAAWLERRRAALEPVLGPLQGQEGADADLPTAADALAAAIAAVHSDLHPLEAPRASEAAASRGALQALVASFYARNGGAAAGAALLDAAGDPARGGSPEAEKVAAGYLSREQLREVDAARRRDPAWVTRELARARQARLERATQRLDAALAAAGGEVARVAQAFREGLVDQARGRVRSADDLFVLGALAARLRRDHPLEVHAEVYRGLPEQLGPAVRRDEVLLAPLSPAQRLALLHALYPGEPWRVGASLPPLRVPGDHATIQSAIDAAAPGQRVQVAAGRVYDEQLRLRPHVQLHGEGASLRHDHRAAILVEDCPGVTVAGFTLLPRHRSLARAPRRPVAGSEERAIVKVVRSAATVSVTVLDPGPCWAVSFLESTGTLGGRLADGAQGGVCVSGPGSHVRIHEASIAMPQGDLVVVTGGALAEVEGGDLSGRGADAGILVLGAGSRVQVDEKGLALVRFEGGAVPDEALARRLAERDRLLGERRRARVAAYVEEKGRTYLDAMRAFMGDDALRREEDERTFLGAPDYRWAHTGRTCAPLLVRLVKDLEATALPGVVEDRARLDALIGEQTRAFLGSHRVVAYAEVVWGVRGERQPGSEAEAASDRARFHEFLDADDADYLEAHKRWRVREARRAQRGRAAGPPDVEPWPTRWERQRIPGTPLSALFPGRQVEMSKREGSREHRHGHVIFVANAGPLPVDAGRPFSREQLERVARNFLDATTQGRGGQVVWEHGLPAPYALGGWRREEVEKNDLTLYRTHAQFILLDRAGRPWRCGLLLLSSFGHLEDEVLRARFFHSLRFE